MNLILLLFPPDSSAAYKINTSRAEITHKFCFGFCSKRTCKLWRNYGIKGMYCLLNFFFWVSLQLDWDYFQIILWFLVSDYITCLSWCFALIIGPFFCSVIGC
jgi:hypothetical protein